jgi:hypothetical protein
LQLLQEVPARFTSSGALCRDWIVDAAKHIPYKVLAAEIRARGPPELVRALDLEQQARMRLVEPPK